MVQSGHSRSSVRSATRVPFQRRHAQRPSQNEVSRIRLTLMVRCMSE
jgi:hypothetical protein